MNADSAPIKAQSKAKAASKAPRVPRARPAGVVPSVPVSLRVDPILHAEIMATMGPGEDLRSRFERLFVRDVQARKLTSGQHKKEVTNSEMMDFLKEEFAAMHEQVIRAGRAADLSHKTARYLIDLLGFIDESSPVPSKIPREELIKPLTGMQRNA